MKISDLSTQHSPEGDASVSSSASAAEPAGAWRLDVQGLRAVAVVLVVAYHASLGVDGGFIGVDVFFVVSGFVICGMLKRELAATGRLSFRRFYARRVRRLLPALSVVTVVVLLATALGMSPLGTLQPSAGLAGSAASIFLANGYFALNTGGYFQPTSATNPFLHTWSLSVEEQFYLVFPIALYLAWRVFRGRRTPLLVLTGVFVLVSLGLGLALTYGWVPYWPMLRTLSLHSDIGSRVAFYAPFSRAWEFLAGVAVSFAIDRRRPGVRLAGPLGVLGLTLILVAAVDLTSTDPFPGILAALPVVGAALVILAGSSASPSSISRALACRPMAALGNWSYSWYLWHWPAIVFARYWYPTNRLAVVLAAAGSLIPAALSYRLIEEPVRSLRVLSKGWQTVVTAAVCIGVPLLAGASLVHAADTNWGRSDIATIERTVRPEHLDEASGCASTLALGNPLRAPCVWAAANSRGTILLIGDSNAGQLSEPVLAAARQLHVDLQIVTDGGCPFVLLAHYSSDACRNVVQSDLHFILARPEPYRAIIVSNAETGYLNPASPTQRTANITDWMAGLRRLTSTLAARSPVINVGAIPQYSDIPECLKPTIWSGQRAASCGHLSSSAAYYLRGSLIRQERTAVAPFTSDFIDLGSLLCRRNGCDVYRGSMLMYRDGAHLSVAGSGLFTSQFKIALRNALTKRRPA